VDGGAGDPISRRPVEHATGPASVASDPCPRRLRSTVHCAVEVVERILGDDPLRPQRDSRRRSAASPGSHSGYRHQRAAAPRRTPAASSLTPMPAAVPIRPCADAPARSRVGWVRPPPWAARRDGRPHAYNL
jgi:hypothetical protein